MRRRPRGFAAFCIAAALPSLLLAGAPPGVGAPITVTGEVLDLACYVAHGGKGPQHAKCAKKCAEEGQPLGLLTAEGKVYVLFADHADVTAFAKVKSLAGTNVEIRGEPAARDGIHGLTVLAVKGA